MNLNELGGFRLRSAEEFEVVERESGVERATVIRHLSTGLEFAYLPGGQFNMGLSEAEEQKARMICEDPPISVSEMRPVRSLTLKPFLISTLPVLNGQLGPFFAEDEEATVPQRPAFPALASYDDAVRFASRHGWRLPTEAEWEFSCRGGATDLFIWGDQVPSDDELSKWLSWDLGNPGEVMRNGFGLGGLFFGEWCSDKFAEDLREGSEATDSQVIKGGGAYFWPWQDEEWVWCLPAMRMPSSDLVTQESAFRVVVDLIPK